MSRHPFLRGWLMIVIGLAIVLPTLAQEEQEPVKDPCAELLAIDTSEFDDENASKQLELSIALLDECLNTLLLGLGGTGGIGINEGLDGVASPFSSLSQDDGNTNFGQDPDSLSTSLTELDDFLDGVEIELDPPSAIPSSLGDGLMESDSQSGLEEPNTQEPVSDEPQEDNPGDSSLESNKVDIESRHTDRNRQPADPKDEDAVLKQIREAAERETDPDTKEALWDQYYDYLDNKKRR